MAQDYDSPCPQHLSLIMSSSSSSSQNQTFITDSNIHHIDIHHVPTHSSSHHRKKYMITSLSLSSSSSSSLHHHTRLLFHSLLFLFLFSNMNKMSCDAFTFCIPSFATIQSSPNLCKSFHIRHNGSLQQQQKQKQQQQLDSQPILNHIFTKSSSSSSLALSSSSISPNDKTPKSSSSSSSSDKKSLTTSQRKTLQISILTICIANSLNLLGFTMQSPLTPSLGQHFNLPLGPQFGSLTSAYPLGMLFGFMIWPRLSDCSSIGRKPILVGSLLGSGLGLGLQSLAIYWNWHWKVFLGCRVFTGCFAGVAPVAKAYLADIGNVLSKANTSTSTSSAIKSTDIIQSNTNTTTIIRNTNATSTIPSTITKTTTTTTTTGKNTAQLAKYLAWRDAASTFAYIIGPVLGGFTFDLWMKFISFQTQTTTTTTTTTIEKSLLLPRKGALAFVIAVSACASLLASGLVSLFVQEHGSTTSRTSNNAKNKKITNSVQTTNSNHNHDHDTKNSNSNNDDNHHDDLIHDYELIQCPLGNSLWSGIISVCIISFLYHIADSTFFAFFPALLQNKLQFDTRTIGMTFTLSACISFLISATSFSSYSIQKFGVVRTCAMGLVSIGVGLGTLSFAASNNMLSWMTAKGLSMGSTGSGMVMKTCLMLGGATLYFCGVPLYGPTIPSMLLQCVPPNQRGTVMGVDGVINTLARVGSPIVIGNIYRKNGATSAFGVASIAVFISATLALVKRYLVVTKNSNMKHD